MARCQLCGTESLSPAFSRNGFNYHRCSNCAALFVDLNMANAAIHARYNETYFESERNAEGRQGYPSYRETRDTLTAGFLQKLKLVTKYVDRGRLLDAGAAYGFFLKVAEPYFQGEGVEISEYAARTARDEFGVSVEQGDIERLDKPDATFDAVVMWDIIEHLVDPTQALLEVNRVLKPGGYLFVSTDDAANWLPRILGRHWWAFGAPLHICHISKKGLTIACERANLGKPLYFSDPRVYSIPEVIKHFGVSYESAWLKNVGLYFSSTFLNKMVIRIARPEQFIAVIRKPA